MLECRASEGNAQPQVALFNAMTISGTPSDICPNLTSIVYGDHFYKFPQKPFFAMVRSRFAPHSSIACRLLCLRVSFQTDPTKNLSRPTSLVVGELKKWRAEGFDARMLDTPDLLLLCESM
jgi:hypothetical protein